MPFKNQHPLYAVWRGMRRRCRNKNFHQWIDYGGRGIGIDPAWDSFHQFVADIGPRPTPQHTLDRIDNDGNYSPLNCRWATKKEQQRNQRGTIFLEFAGVSYRLADLAEDAGIKPDTIVERHRKGMSLAEATAKTRYACRASIAKAVAARVSKQRNASHCKHGHPWSPENTRITKEGWKNCRRCAAIKMRRLNAAKRRQTN